MTEKREVGEGERELRYQPRFCYLQVFVFACLLCGPVSQAPLGGQRSTFRSMSCPSTVDSQQHIKLTLTSVGGKYFYLLSQHTCPALLCWVFCLSVCFVLLLILYVQCFRSTWNSVNKWKSPSLCLFEIWFCLFPSCTWQQSTRLKSSVALHLLTVSVLPTRHATLTWMLQNWPTLTWVNCLITELALHFPPCFNKGVLSSGITSTQALQTGCRGSLLCLPAPWRSRPVTSLSMRG